MKLRRSKKSPQPTQAQHLDQQVNEILGLIISEVRCQSIQDVANLCLVSRQFYILAVPHLYRKVTLDFDRASHFRLLRRLGRPGSHLPVMIRHLHLCLEEKYAEHRHRIEKLFDGLTNLEELDWEGPLHIPVSILAKLYTRFRRARLSIKSKGALWESPTTGVPLISSIHLADIGVAHPITTMVTHLCLTLNGEFKIWACFREDLIFTIIKNPALISLQIIAARILENRRTSMADTMKEHVLPKLQELHLFVANSPVFTQDELLVWSLQGGCENLRFLVLNHIQSFIPFVGGTQKLEELWLFPRKEEGTANLESRLDEWKDFSPFPALRRLKLRSPWSETTPVHHTHRVIPWHILDLLPLGQLKYLDVSRPYQEPQNVTDVLQAEGIAKLRDTCPDLDELRFDMVLPWSREPWPSSIFRELAAFTKPIKLTVLLHISGAPGEEGCLRFVARFLRFCFRSSFKIGRCLCEERESQKIASKPPLSVDVIWSDDFITETDEIIMPKRSGYSINIHEGASGACSSLVLHSRRDCLYDEDLDTMSLQDLEDNKKPRVENILFGRDRYTREIKRRKDGDRVGPGGYEADITLYDFLMQSESKGSET
ncbi:hypothetical protein G6011_08326 [Alternaria panax]|uniref:Uncharacterized protein n=1 Tax=Alternaria panax TaxID=48097 RepID=A0AAD4FHP6_9PLEO|nr:hypothetical protein G6011_08326 [Alternaria panax]